MKKISNNEILLQLKGGFWIAITLFVGFSCEKKAEQTLPKRNYELTWSEDFNDS
jgi:hypothetical protein